MCSQDPRQEMQPLDFRCVLSRFSQDSTVTCKAFVNNRQSSFTMTKHLKYTPNPNPYDGDITFSDIDTQVNNVVFNWTGANQGWKVFFLLEWTGGGSITNIQSSTNDITTYNPLLTQAASK